MLKNIRGRVELALLLASVALALAGLATALTGVAAAHAYRFPPRGVTTSSVTYQSVTCVHPANVVFSDHGTAYHDIVGCGSITATGRQFIPRGKCAVTNMDGTGADYRMTVGIAVDGVPHGEDRAWLSPTTLKDYADAEWPGALVEGIDPTYPSTHTFKLQVWGVAGEAAFAECNFTVEAIH